MLDAAECRYGLADPEAIAALTGGSSCRRSSPANCRRRRWRRPSISAWSKSATASAAFEGEPGEAFLNPMGAVHGGWALTLVDSATGCAGMSLLPPGAAYTTIETKVNFSRPITKDAGRVRAEAWIVSRGRRILSAEARVTDTKGRVLAHGTSTLMVLERGRRLLAGVFLPSSAGEGGAERRMGYGPLPQSQVGLRERHREPATKHTCFRASHPGAARHFPASRRRGRISA